MENESKPKGNLRKENRAMNRANFNILMMKFKVTNSVDTTHREKGQ
jgi:hypothetical protein